MGRTVLAATLLALSMIACSSKGESACGKAFAEPIDQNSSVHILPGQPELAYTTNPPTSGAHRIAEIPAGVSSVEIDKPRQVHILESGRVLIQYKDLKDADRDTLRRLVSDEVVVAPNRSLDKPVVATAWLFKMECTAVDASALGAFVEAHAEKQEGR